MAKSQRRGKSSAQSSRPGRSQKPRAEAVSHVPVIYGIHAVKAALENPDRVVSKVMATKNAADRFSHLLINRALDAEISTPEQISAITGQEAVHQGIAIIVMPLEGYDLYDLKDADLVVVLDQVTDPHNVGAIMRSAVALGAEAIVTTHRNTPRESGLMAKIASGGMDMIRLITVPNLAQALVKMNEFGFTTIGLDSEGPADLKNSFFGDKIALVLGAEGQGLRRLTRERCDVLARLDMPGRIKSLNVSNAAVLSLHLAHTYLNQK